jgi:hypothetical protein
MKRHEAIAKRLDELDEGNTPITSLERDAYFMKAEAEE